MSVDVGTRDRRVAVYERQYNERGLLVGEQLVVRATRNTATAGTRYDETGATRSDAIVDIRYDAKGQKTLLRLGNGTTTRYDYDPVTLRLRQPPCTCPPRSRLRRSACGRDGWVRPRQICRWWRTRIWRPCWYEHASNAFAC